MLLFVIDQSGSMASCKQEVIDGFNGYLADRRTEQGEMVVSAYTFDTTVTQLYNGEPLQKVVDLSAASYTPAGGTALFDAVGRAISDADKIVRDDDRVLCVILTDGAENMSQEFGGEAGQKKIANMIREREGTGRWTFTYIGAAEDAWDAAQSMGIQAGNAAIYNASMVGGTAEAFSRMSRSTAGYVVADSLSTDSFYQGNETPADVTLTVDTSRDKIGSGA